jgi:hypothetical protein
MTQMSTPISEPAVQPPYHPQPTTSDYQPDPGLPQSPRSPTNTLAIVSLVSGIVWLGETLTMAGSSPPRIVKTDCWETTDTVEHTIDQLVSVLDARQWKVTQRDATHVEARRGSRLVLRLLGVFLPPGRSRLPMRVQLSVRAMGEPSVVEAVVESDEGWYLFRVPQLCHAYEADFTSLLEALKAGILR